MLYGGIEAGGTKFVCAVADENQNILEQVSIPTTQPEETLEKVFAFFDQFTLAAMGVGSFGPIDIQTQSETYGYVLATPKKGWANYPFLPALKERYDIPMAWTTDVNAAAYGELKMGAAKGKSSCIYLTVGTGIGAGVVINGDVYQGIAHPEMGHIRVKRNPEDSYEGTCPFHKDCLEGLAAGPSLEKRTGTKGQYLSENDPVWEIEADYIAQALMTYTLTLAPEKIILGGGVMNQQHLVEKIRKAFEREMAGYVVTPPLDEYIVTWGLPNKSGILGCTLLAENLVK
ncbi:fructokinase [Enterococcus sp. JM4C]|uniref:ROK family protein n=1 Tax=Candidatus Enterococcus huntleyi TaxID=1857217 RepID=UPI00137AC5EC|nr:ROK family protein [Enterococcus sp. JM4C]KAF1296659.1 fructokinase [Enterococcus sp. JM4C]